MKLAQEKGESDKVLMYFSQARNHYEEAMRLYPHPQIINNLARLQIEAEYYIEARILIDEDKEKFKPEDWSKLDTELRKREAAVAQAMD